jgi:hypothetical protein
MTLDEIILSTKRKRAAKHRRALAFQAGLYILISAAVPFVMAWLK